MLRINNEKGNSSFITPIRFWMDTVHVHSADAYVSSHIINQTFTKFSNNVILAKYNGSKCQQRKHIRE